MTATHFDRSLLRELHPHDGFLLHRTEVQALAEDFPLDAKLLYAPRALLEVVAGGQPRRSAQGVHFFQVTPLCVIAAGRAFSKMHEDYFGSILMDRGDRVSIQGDGHPTMAAALAAFGDRATHALVWTMLNKA